MGYIGFTGATGYGRRDEAQIRTQVDLVVVREDDQVFSAGINKHRDLG